MYALCTFVAFGRAGCAWPDTPACAKVIRLEAEIPPFSSTEIRARVHRGLSIEGMTADAVVDYIGAKRLYDPPRLLTDA